ncbi:MAG: hypothetical protein U9O64_04930 [Campylobacterota bacterium]|nr:hypothetical protein [Campylobacterota bacterium]
MMLPLVLGGIALAAVGYGLKEYCESEGCPWDEEENTLSRSDEVRTDFETFHKIKIELYKDYFVDSVQLLSQVENMPSKNLKQITATFSKELHDSINNDVAEMLTASKEVLLYVQDILMVSVRNMQNILEESTDYRSYSKEEQEVFMNGQKLLKLTGKLCHTPLVGKDGFLSETYEGRVRKLVVFIKENWKIGKLKRLELRG